MKTLQRESGDPTVTIGPRLATLPKSRLAEGNDHQRTRVRTDESCSSSHANGCRYAAEYLPVTKCSSCRSISPSIELAPYRNSVGSSHDRPSSSFIVAIQSSACLAVLIPPAGLNPTAMPVRSPYSRHARIITRLTGSVAFTASLPVDVLMKSVPAIIANQLARATFLRVNKSPVPRMAFMCAGPHASLNAATSSYRAFH